MSEDTAAYFLIGMSLPGEWRVVSRLEIPPGKTGGACSVGYLVKNKDGVEGFLKAFDYSAALQSKDPPQEFADLTNRYIAERELLDLCAGRKLDRIVRVLGHGTVQVSAVQPSAVSYLIFELAQGDARDAVSDPDCDPADHAPMLQLAHHAAVGVFQLQSVGGFHHDLKPSNLLVGFSGLGSEAKLGDLGSAFLKGRPAPQDEDHVAGDPTYAPPEQLYKSDIRETFTQWRAAGDAYMFGGLVSFLLTGVPFGAIVTMSLDPSLSWSEWTGTFEEVLPALVDAHQYAVNRLESALDVSIASDVAKLVGQLCHPDPELRGHPKSRRFGQNPFDLERYVSTLNLLHRRASFNSRKCA